MDRQEAKLVLQAHRPNGLDAMEPAFAEALALVEHDPELKAWWEAQQAFDRRVAAELKEVQIPDDLRDTILTGRKIERLTPQPSLLSWLAAAAVVAILCVVGTFKEIALASGPMPMTEYAAAVIPFLKQNGPDLAMTSSDRDEVIAWLKEQNAPIATLPGGMTSLPVLGCHKYVVHGHVVALICFTMPSGTEAHLFAVDEDAISDAEDNNPPAFNQVHGWTTASWSDGRMTYLLATQAGPDALKQLL